MSPISATFAAPRSLARQARTLAFLALGALLASAQAWTLDDVAQLARQRAQTPFVPLNQPLPAELAGLDYDGLRDIRFNDDKALWRADKLPYEAKFFHVGRQSDTVRIHEVSALDNKALPKPLPYDTRDFDFGKNTLKPATWGDVGYAGFRAHAALNSPDYKDELVVFLGASYFRALGAGQRYGLSARGLAVDTAGAGTRPEEFPRFTDFWLEKPTADAKQLTVYALLDSPRMSGAYRFVIRPGEQTVTEVHARVFMRAGAAPAVATLGLAPLTSMFFFGENQPRASDFRPEVHDSDGLMIATDDGKGGGEWLWRPLQNPSAPLVTSFAMAGLKGFGLMQRDRAFGSYEDTEASYELRPSAWVTPIGDWGPGRVELLQLPTPDETHDNVVAYWVPERLPQAGQSLDFAYQLAWQGEQQQRPPNGWVAQSRRGIGYSKLDAATLQQTIQYVIDFAGPALDPLDHNAPVRAVASSDANGRVLESNTWRNPATGRWRMTLRVQRIDPAKPVELRAFLQHNNHTVSETWTTVVTP
ncbi:glucan biosynthesis protein G [Polaromonas sp. SM01]|uniref:glucan biosynthesis protein G n=1 Tax=Polaromonas sp. SM01 TaxID=3085630 RepID=UPI002981A826|nr:glucan biosynthesis protein G [Polaromonas sp. SM01]MDW5443548.1 glucan biosynthesis protein G [Polaromonas sp. SM01]